MRPRQGGGRTTTLTRSSARRRQKLLVAEARRETDREPVPEPARLERVLERRVGVSAGLSLAVFSEIGGADQSREHRQRVGTALPFLRPTSHAVQSIGFALEDRQVQIDGWIEGLSRELFVPAERRVEMVFG